jgi:hypothetical protein
MICGNSLGQIFIIGRVCKASPTKNNRVLRLTPLFPVDYTRLIARSTTVHFALAVNLSRGFGPPGSSAPTRRKWLEGTRGRLGREEPLESIKRVSLQQQIDRWMGKGLTWLLRKLLARTLGTAGQTSVRRPVVTRSALALHRDPWCGTYVSPEISFPLEQSGQILHFCSAECRMRYQRSSQRAASA